MAAMPRAWTGLPLYEMSRYKKPRRAGDVWEMQRRRQFGLGDTGWGGCEWIDCSAGRLSHASSEGEKRQRERGKEPKSETERCEEIAEKQAGGSGCCQRWPSRGRCRTDCIAGGIARMVVETRIRPRLKGRRAKMATSPGAWALFGRHVHRGVAYWHVTRYSSKVPA
jgi:hypothetical protein